MATRRRKGSKSIEELRKERAQARAERNTTTGKVKAAAKDTYQRGKSAVGAGPKLKSNPKAQGTTRANARRTANAGKANSTVAGALVGASKAVKAVKGTSTTSKPGKTGTTMRNKPGKVEATRRKVTEAADTTMREVKRKAGNAKVDVENAVASGKKAVSNAKTTVQNKVASAKKSRASKADAKVRFKGGPTRAAGNKPADPRDTANSVVPKAPTKKSYSKGKAPLKSAGNTRTNTQKVAIGAKSAKERIMAKARGLKYKAGQAAQRVLDSTTLDEKAVAAGKSAVSKAKSGYKSAKAAVNKSAQSGLIRKAELKGGAAVSGAAAQLAKRGGKVGNKVAGMALNDNIKVTAKRVRDNTKPKPANPKPTLSKPKISMPKVSNPNAANTAFNSGGNRGSLSAAQKRQLAEAQKASAAARKGKKRYNA